MASCQIFLLNSSTPGASSCDGLLDGLVTDDAMKKSHGSIANDFKGSDIEPVEKLAF
jgi:hypothetical protein